MTVTFIGLDSTGYPDLEWLVQIRQVVHSFAFVSVTVFGILSQRVQSDVFTLLLENGQVVCGRCQVKRVRELRSYLIKLSFLSTKNGVISRSGCVLSSISLMGL